MTAAPGAAGAAVDGMPAAIAALRANGLRVSSARRIVLEALFAAAGPATAEELAAGPGLIPRSDLASTYRNLETLEAIGLVRHLHFGQGAGRYVLRRGEESGYVSCRHCGAYEPMGAATVAALSDTVRDSTGYDAAFASFSVIGLCAACRADDA
jgi:Fur family ferric uptake transcriptional regulator